RPIGSRLELAISPAGWQLPLGLLVVAPRDFQAPDTCAAGPCRSAVRSRLAWPYRDRAGKARWTRPGHRGVTSRTGDRTRKQHIKKGREEQAPRTILAPVSLYCAVMAFSPATQRGLQP